MHNKHTFTTELKKTFLLSVPLVAALLAQMGMDLIDTIMLGRLGPEALAAGALGMAVFIFLFVGCMGFAISCGSLMAGAHGANDENKTVFILHQGIWFTFFLAIPCWLILWFTPHFLIFLNHDPKLVDIAERFIHTLMWGLLPGLWFICLREFSAVLNHARSVMIISILAIPINALGNYAFMYGKWGMPNLGVAGIGFASSLVNLLMFLSLLWYLTSIKKVKTMKILHRFGLPIKNHMCELIKIGWPVSITLIFEVGLFSVSSLLMGKFGTIQLAAHQIALQCSTISFMIPLGISQAAAIRVGQAMGANEPQRAKLATLSGIAIGLFFAMIAAYLFYFHARALANFYLNAKTLKEFAVISQAVIFLRICVAFQFFDVLQVILSGALRGMKDTLIPMLLGMISYWLVGLASGTTLAFYFNLQGVGLWWGLVLGIFISGILLLWRFYFSMKQYNIVT